MQSSLRRKWDRVARNNRTEPRSPLSEENPHILPKTTTQCTTDADEATGDYLENEAEPIEVRQDYKAIYPKANQSPRVKIKAATPNETDKACLKGENIQSHSFGRHSAARKQLRNRASLSSVTGAEQVRHGPSKPRSTPELHGTSRARTVSKPPMLRPSLGRSPCMKKSQIKETDSTAPGLTTSSISPMIEIGTQTDLEDAKEKPTSVKLDTPSRSGDSTADLTDRYSDALIQRKSLDLGISEPLGFQGPIHQVCFNYEDYSDKNRPEYDVDDLRRVINTRVTLQWKGLKAPHIEELFRIHEASMSIIQEMVSKKMAESLANSPAIEDGHGTHEILLPERELCNKLGQMLYGLHSSRDFRFQPAGILHAYLASLDYLHRGRTPKRDINAIFLAAMSEDDNLPTSVSDFAAIAFPDVVFFSTTLHRLYEADSVQFFPLYLAANPFQAREENIEIKYSTDAPWLTWCNETASFKGIVPTAHRSVSGVVQEYTGRHSIEVTVRAVVRLKPVNEDCSVLPTFEKQVATKLRYDVHKRQAVKDARRMSADLRSCLRAVIASAQPHSSAEDPKPLKPDDVEAWTSNSAMLLRAQRCASMSMRLFDLANKFSTAALDCAETWHGVASIVHKITEPEAADSLQASSGRTSASKFSTRSSSNAYNPVFRGGGRSEQPHFSTKTLEQTAGWHGATDPLHLPRIAAEELEDIVRNFSKGTDSPSKPCGHSISSEYPRSDRSNTSAQMHDPMTPPISPPLRPISQEAEAHKYFHPLHGMEWNIVDQVACPIETQSGTVDMTNARTEEFPIPQCSPSTVMGLDAKESSGRHSQKKRKKSVRRAKGKKVHKHVAFRTKESAPSPLSQEVRYDWDVDDYASDASRKGKTPMRLEAETIQPDVRLSAEEVKQLEQAIAMSLKDQVVKATEKTREPENWDDVFETLDDSE